MVAYYDKPFWAARLTRCHTARLLLGLVGRHAPHGGRGAIPAELGGGGAGGSCFHHAFMEALTPRQYHILDNHRPELERMAACLGTEAATVLHETNILHDQLGLKADVVFSVGLIEHFDAAGTPKALATWSS